MKKYFLFLLSLFFLPVKNAFAQDAGLVKFVIKEASFQREGDSDFLIKLYIQNTTKDTIRIIRPSADVFDNNYSRSPLHYIGSNSKPYHLNLLIKKECSTLIEKPPLEQPRNEKSIYFNDADLVVIPPMADSKEYSFRFYTGFQDFCGDGEYFCTINYKPDFQLLEDHQLIYLEEKYEKMESILEEQNNYIKEHNLYKGEPHRFIYNAKKILENHYLLSLVTNTTGQSEEMEIVKKK